MRVFVIGGGYGGGMDAIVSLLEEDPIEASGEDCPVCEVEIVLVRRGSVDGLYASCGCGLLAAVA